MGVCVCVSLSLVSPKFGLRLKLVSSQLLPFKIFKKNKKKKILFQNPIHKYNKIIIIIIIYVISTINIGSFFDRFMDSEPLT